LIALVALSLVTFIGVASTVGIRLLLRFRDRRDVPQLCIGLGFLLIGGLGYPPTVVSGMGTGTVEDTVLPAYALGSLFMNVGVACLLAFTRTAFRPRAPWAGALLWLGSAVLVGASLGSIQALREAPPDAMAFSVTAPWNAALQVVCVLGFGWTAAEAIQCYRRSVRRRTIGLSSPEVTNRFLLWSIFGGGTCAISTINAIVQLAGINPATSWIVHGTMVPLVIASSVAIWLAFLPPAWYLERLGGDAPDAGGGVVARP